MTKNAETTLDIQLEDLPGYLLRIVSTRALSELGHILERHGLRVVDATILVHIDEQPGCMQRDVGDRFNIVSANLTPLISKLEARGLVKRKPIDGRSNGIHLTQKGRALKAKAWKEMLKFEENLMSKVSG